MCAATFEVDYSGDPISPLSFSVLDGRQWRGQRRRFLVYCLGSSPDARLSGMLLQGAGSWVAHCVKTKNGCNFGNVTAKT